MILAFYDEGKGHKSLTLKIVYFILSHRFIVYSIRFDKYTVKAIKLIHNEVASQLASSVLPLNFTTTLSHRQGHLY